MSAGWKDINSGVDDLASRKDNLFGITKMLLCDDDCALYALAGNIMITTILQYVDNMPPRTKIQHLGLFL